MAVYERSTTAVLPEEQYEVVSILWNKSRRNEIVIYSVTKVLILQKKKKVWKQSTSIVSRPIWFCDLAGQLAG